MQFFFENHVLDVDRRELKRGVNSIEIGPQVFDLLVYLVRNRDRVVSKNDLIADVWGGRIVSDSNLDSRITAARKAIGDDGVRQSLIRTLPRKGVRFVGVVTESPKPERREIVDAPLANVYTKGEPSICVLPFQNRSGDAEDHYLADGMADEVTTELSGYGWLKVIAPSTSFSYRDKAFGTGMIGRELAVRYVLKGNIRRQGGRVRVVAQLLEAATARQIWAQRYERNLGDLFDLQSEIAQCVAGAIQPELITAEMHRLRGTLPENMEAWDYAVRGRWHVLRIRREDNAKAKAYLKQALELDENCVAALAFLAYSQYVDVFYGWSPSPSESLKQASEFALKAAALDENDCWVQCALALGKFIAKEPETAIAHLRKAIAANPSFALGHGYLALVLAFSGEPEIAIDEAQRAISLSPKDPELFHFFVAIGTAHFVAGRYDKAAEWGKKVIAEQPLVPSGHRLVATSLGHLGRTNDARAALSHALEITPMLSATYIRKNIYFRDPNDLERYISGMQAAGLSA